MRALLVVIALAGCAREEPQAADACEQANMLLERCGVTLPVVQNGACIGASRIVARCVSRHASNCEELAELPRKLDLCIEDEVDAGDSLLPELPVAPPADAAPDSITDSKTDSALDAVETKE